jgi:hypothetical protein
MPIDMEGFEISVPEDLKFKIVNIHSGFLDDIETEKERRRRQKKWPESVWFKQ